MSLSKIVITGRVIRDPEKRFTPNANVAVTEFAISVESPRRSEGPPETNVVKVVTWRDLAERVAGEIKKGDVVAVDGRLQTNNYTTQDGQRRREVEIDAIAVENLRNTVNAEPSVAAEGEDREVAGVGAAKESSKDSSKGGSEDLDSIFASEDEIPF